LYDCEPTTLALGEKAFCPKGFPNCAGLGKPFDVIVSVAIIYP
jgi:hypothetical protein